MAIVVKSSALTEASGKFRTESTKISDTIGSIDLKISALKDENDSEVLRDLYEKFLTFKTASLPRYLEVIEQYAAHLDKVAEKYKALETTHKSNVQAIDNNKAFK